jgi:hypothetical protein
MVDFDLEAMSLWAELRQLQSAAKAISPMRTGIRPKLELLS